LRRYENSGTGFAFENREFRLFRLENEKRERRTTMRTLMRYFWRVYYVFRPVKGGLLSDLLRSTARKQGVRIVEHRLVRRTTSYSGLGWVAGKEEKDRANGGVK
jgi:hypothetical protein